MKRKEFKSNLKLLWTIPLMSIGLAAYSPAYTEDELFDVTALLLAPIVIRDVQALSFPDTVAGQDILVEVTPAEANAGVFNAIGEASRSVNGGVVETSIEMVTGDGAGDTKRIRVDAFETGGDMDSAGNAAFDGSGNLTNLRVGATANIEASDIPGNYRGTATFRLVYN